MSLAAAMPFIATMPFIVLVIVHAFALAVLAAGAAAAGAWIAVRLPSPGRDPGTERLAVSIASGLGLLGSALFFVGFDRGTLLALAGLLLAAAGLAWRRRARKEGAGEARFEAFALAAIGGALLPAFVWTLYPPTAYDATVYHLPFARAFVASGHLVATPELLFEVFPQLGESLFAALLAVTGNDRTPALVQLLAVATTALLLYSAGRRFYSRRAGLWATALWLAHPLVHYQAASAYVDATLALFCLLAIVAWENFRESEHRGWLALAGGGAGWAAATKYLGVIWLALVAALVVAASGASGRRAVARRLVDTLLFLAVAALVAGPWYVRNYRVTGSAFHPFFASTSSALAGTPPEWRLGRANALSWRELPAAAAERLLDAASRPADLARFAWQASFEPAAFQRQAPLAPWALVLAPLAMIFAVRDRRLRRWLVLVGAYAIFWTTTQPRFQLPGAALLALAGAGALERLAEWLAGAHAAAAPDVAARGGSGARPRLGRRLQSPAIAGALAVVLLAPGPLYALYKLSRFGVAPPVTAEARGAFLERELAGYAGVAWLERERGSDYSVFLLDAPNLTYFVSGRVRGLVRGPYRIGRVRPLLGRPNALHRELRAMGVDYLLVTARARPRLGDGERFRALFRRVEGDARHDLYELATVPAPLATPPAAD